MQTTFLANIPSPPQGVWHLGPFPIRAYALCIIVGILLGLWLSKKRYVARGGDPEMVWDAAIILIPAGIIGGRAYHVLTDWKDYFGPGANPIDALKITNGGLGIWGAVFLGSLAVYFWFRHKGVAFAPFADATAPGIILGQAFGRLGNWFNQELYGGPTDLPWALEIYYRVDEYGHFAPLSGHSTGNVLATVHPTFLYELLWNLLICALLILVDKRFHLDRGRVFVLYVAGYTLGRFWIELMRTDAATHIFGWRINSLVAALVFVVAVLIFWRISSRRETTPEVAYSGALETDN
ncbi:prolipoprotein diacylglyceryl transferase [Corynebacterium caspium]|uniref:prolipoprotein diacylglyceryl transferase n=1 Tax=Corynebacterium caspium TaxID=234828 RepID=UPI000374C06D|nr:prolipoprotein diacylglyceryl transferase [Corynebacterium caspium]WKD59034.1 Prolipoprotein diacylglyceryl transferase [Corynebacterium caspium DSM 44850]